MKISFSRHGVWFAVMLFTFTTSAYFNLGYFHPDEHYQLIEFAGLILGWNNASDLAWEYTAMMRPTLQVWICVAWFKTLSWLGFQDPYGLAFSLRLLSAAVALASIRFFIRSTTHLLKPEYHSIYEFLFCFLWFIPLVSVRFSSETWSGLSFLLALACTVNESEMKGRYYWLGLLMGVSFLFRFQVGIMELCLLLWIMLVKREKWINFLTVIILMTFVIQLGLLLDAAFYGKYTYTFWNYFQTTILQDDAPSFGTSPWTTMLIYLWDYPLWPIGLVISVSIFILIIGQPTNVFIWCLLPFLIVHALIPHKEIRFLFPLVWLIPIIVMLAIQEVRGLWKVRPRIGILRVMLGCVALLMLLNGYALPLVLVKPAGTGQKYLTKYIADKYPDKPIHLFHTPYSNPYEPWLGLSENFYKRANILTTEIEGSTWLRQLDMQSDTIYLLAVKRFERSYFINPRIMWKYDVRFELQSIPVWIEKLNRGYIGVNNDMYIELYSLRIKDDMNN